MSITAMPAATGAVPPTSSAYAQRTPQTASSQANSSALEEANETVETTRQEAAHGDRVAIKKLARIQQQQKAQTAKPAKEPGKGSAIDRYA